MERKITTQGPTPKQIKAARKERNKKSGIKLKKKEKRYVQKASGT